jgi:hypothetical protein
MPPASGVAKLTDLRHHAARFGIVTGSVAIDMANPPARINHLFSLFAQRTLRQKLRDLGLHVTHSVEADDDLP